MTYAGEQDLRLELGHDTIFSLLQCIFFKIIKNDTVICSMKKMFWGFYIVLLLEAITEMTDMIQFIFVNDNYDNIVDNCFG